MLAMKLILLLCCRSQTEMRCLLPFGWQTRRSCFISSAVTSTLLVSVLRLRTCWPSVCSMLFCCSSTLCRTDFIKRCLYSSAQTRMLTVLLVSASLWHFPGFIVVHGGVRSSWLGEDRWLLYYNAMLSYSVYNNISILCANSFWQFDTFCWDNIIMVVVLWHVFIVVPVCRVHHYKLPSVNLTVQQMLFEV